MPALHLAEAADRGGARVWLHELRCAARSAVGRWEWLGVEHAIVLCAGLWAAAGLATLAAARPLLDRAERAG
ncbi:hypothetical protein FHX44_11792 [Pseudonocardia hierapolitana]|uniref:Uncharacterized protein n=1 Tax=Pseudonocardia hierapolitana TaxID=1128676 RepID=A0A561SJA0_9PSEU|nr:hypothetical protein [Pseudonocardia hierapolitana]TWF74909.1 hypothetical protein FHX44_11792 [Pseudonocardia hierapolitana]